MTNNNQSVSSLAAALTRDHIDKFFNAHQPSASDIKAMLKPSHTPTFYPPNKKQSNKKAWIILSVIIIVLIIIAILAIIIYILLKDDNEQK